MSKNANISLSVVPDENTMSGFSISPDLVKSDIDHVPIERLEDDFTETVVSSIEGFDHEAMKPAANDCQRNSTAATKKTQYYKTKICPWHKEGKCFMGESCNYAHSKHELIPKPDLSRTKLCPEIIKSRRCMRVGCRFAHDFVELRATTTFYKTRICKFWQRGFCPAGTKCRHAHGKNDLREKLSAEQEFSSLATQPRIALRTHSRQFNSTDNHADNDPRVVLSTGISSLSGMSCVTSATKAALSKRTQLTGIPSVQVMNDSSKQYDYLCDWETYGCLGAFSKHSTHQDADCFSKQSDSELRLPIPSAASLASNNANRGGYKQQVVQSNYTSPNSDGSPAGLNISPLLRKYFQSASPLATATDYSGMHQNFIQSLLGTSPSRRSSESCADARNKNMFRNWSPQNVLPHKLFAAPL